MRSLSLLLSSTDSLAGSFFGQSAFGRHALVDESSVRLSGLPLARRLTNIPPGRSRS